ncbi:MAG: 50S ribosomal protein L29 [Acholeplasmatales bacterium]|jgi:large subunit ribosomal protein L29|nr:50S ribosomal protein L29 [Acholeplasmatales bacterium]
MTNKEIRNLSVEEINKQISELKDELFNLKLQSSLNQLTNTARIASVKKTIARMKTILAEKNSEVR